jgi:hypothetical protein
MRVTIEQFKSIRTFDDTLYHQLLGVSHGIGNGVVEIDESHPLIAGEAFQKGLSDWKKANGIVEAPKPPEHNDSCSCPDCFSKRTSEIVRKEAARLEAEKKSAETLQPGLDRLQEYFKAGLVDSPENAALFDRTWREHPQLSKIRESSPQVVDAVIAVCRQQLKWRSAEPTLAPTPAAPVRTLANGEPELPIDALTTGAYRGASKAQLQDLSRRLGEGQSWFKRGKGTGSFGANLDTGRQSQVM